jgi:hypothetical protein
MGQRPSNERARRRDHRGRSVSCDRRWESDFDRDAVPSATVEGVRRPLDHNNELIVERIHRSGTVYTHTVESHCLRAGQHIFFDQSAPAKNTFSIRLLYSFLGRFCLF